MNFLTISLFLTFYVITNPSIDCFFIQNPINWFRKTATESPENMTVPTVSSFDSTIASISDQVSTQSYEELFQVHINQRQPIQPLVSLADRLSKPLKRRIGEIFPKTKTKKLEVTTTQLINSYELNSENFNQTLTSGTTTQSYSTANTLIEGQEYNISSELEFKTEPTVSEEVSPTPVYRSTSPATDEILINSSEVKTTKPIFIQNKELTDYHKNIYYKRYDNNYKPKMKNYLYNRFQRRQSPKEYDQTGPYQAYHPSYNHNPGESGEDEDDFEDQYELVKTGSWLFPGIIGFIMSILPLTIVVASLIPAVVSVPVVSTTPFGRRFKRSVDEILNKQIFEILLVLNKYETNSLEDPKCLTEMFCTFVASGKTFDMSTIQNIIYHIIDGTPKQWTKLLEVDKLFNAIKQNNCETAYNCMFRKVTTIVFKGHRQIS